MTGGTLTNTLGNYLWNGVAFMEAVDSTGYPDTTATLWINRVRQGTTKIYYTKPNGSSASATYYNGQYITAKGYTPFTASFTASSTSLCPVAVPFSGMTGAAKDIGVEYTDGGLTMTVTGMITADGSLSLSTGYRMLRAHGGIIKPPPMQRGSSMRVSGNLYFDAPQSSISSYFRGANGMDVPKTAYYPNPRVDVKVTSVVSSTSTTTPYGETATGYAWQWPSMPMSGAEFSGAFTGVKDDYGIYWGTMIAAIRGRSAGANTGTVASASSVGNAWDSVSVTATSNNTGLSAFYGYRNAHPYGTSAIPPDAGYSGVTGNWRFSAII